MVLSVGTSVHRRKNNDFPLGAGPVPDLEPGGFDPRASGKTLHLGSNFQHPRDSTGRAIPQQVNPSVFDVFEKHFSLRHTIYTYIVSDLKNLL